MTKIKKEKIFKKNDKTKIVEHEIKKSSPKKNRKIKLPQEIKLEAAAAASVQPKQEKNILKKVKKNKKQGKPISNSIGTPGQSPAKENNNINAPKSEKSKKNNAVKNDNELTVQKSPKVKGDDSTKAKEKQNYKENIEKTIFVGNLPPNTKPIQLKKLFIQFGKVKSVRMRTADGKVIFKHKTRKEAGALNGYVVMEDNGSIEKALKLNGSEFKGKHLRVNKATAPDENSDAKRTVFVGNLKYSVTDEKLHNIFSSCGEIEYVRTLQSNKGCKGVGYVCFKTPDAITLALELKNTMLEDRPIHVERYSKNKQGAKVKRENEERQLSGSSRRINDKKKMSKPVGNSKLQRNVKKSEPHSNTEKKKNKSEFRGVKTDVKKFKKKKKTSKLQLLAKKIAPKALKQH